MTTRHTSAENVYPFYPTGEELPLQAQGIVDLWFVVHGPPTQVSDSSSSASSSTLAGDQTRLVAVTTAASSTTYTFHIYRDEAVWVVDFEVDHTAEGTGVVQNSDRSSVNAVLTYNGNNIVQVGQYAADQLVEPSRTVYYHQAVAKLTFENLTRCNGVEYAATEVVHEVTPSSPLISLGDGYNMDLSVEGGELQLLAGNGNGLGKVPSISFGDTDNCASSSSGEPSQDEVSLLRVINGVLPVNGDVNIEGSRRVGLLKHTGRITLVVRRA